MRAHVVITLLASLLVLSAGPAVAAEGDAPVLFASPTPAWHLSFDGHDPERVTIHPAWLPRFLAEPATRLAASPVGAAPALQGAPPPTAYVYSDGYEFRHKVHKYASWATVPLFVAQAIVGQKISDGDASSAMKDTHSVLAGLTGALFAVNTVTGVWNLWEGWDNPTGRTKRIVHSVLMLGAGAAFLATAGSAPESEHGEVEGSTGTHRNAAIVGFSSATAGYLLMLLSR